MAPVHFELLGDDLGERAFKTAVDQSETCYSRQRWSRKILGDASAREYAVSFAIVRAEGHALRNPIPQRGRRICRAAKHYGSGIQRREARDDLKNGIGPAADLAGESDNFAAPDSEVDRPLKPF